MSIIDIFFFATKRLSVWKFGLEILMWWRSIMVGLKLFEDLWIPLVHNYMMIGLVSCHIIYNQPTFAWSYAIFPLSTITKREFTFLIFCEFGIQIDPIDVLFVSLNLPLNGDLEGMCFKNWNISQFVKAFLSWNIPKSVVGRM